MTALRPGDFILDNHYRFFNNHAVGSIPTSPGFHDIGGMYTTMSITKRGILDLPFHLNRLYRQCIFLNYLEENAVTKQDLIQVALQACHQALTGRPFTEGLLMVCCGKAAAGTYSLVDINALFYPTPFTIPSLIPPPTIEEEGEEGIKKPHTSNNPYIVDFYPMRRNPPQVKYTRWALERQPIISHRSLEVQETIIYDQGLWSRNEKDGSVVIEVEDYLTEGLTSTLYLLTEDHQILMPPTEKILYGTIQRWIQFIAPLLGITIVEQPITFTDILTRAKGAFLTSSGRILQPIHRMRLPPQIQEKYQLKESEINFSYHHKGDLLEKLKVVAFHLMHSEDEHWSTAVSTSSKQLFTSEELKGIEEKVLAQMGYYPWVAPQASSQTWTNELQEEGLVERLIRDIEKIQQD